MSSIFLKKKINKFRVGERERKKERKRKREREREREEGEERERERRKRSKKMLTDFQTQFQMNTA